MPLRDLIAGDDDSLQEAYLRAIESMFHGQQWEAVEPDAERAWNSISWREPRRWSDVRDTIKAAWLSNRHA